MQTYYLFQSQNAPDVRCFTDDPSGSKSSEAASKIAGVPAGTIRRRLHTARRRLADLLDVSSVSGIGPGELMKAATRDHG